MVAEHMVKPSHVYKGMVEIPQLRNVGLETDVVGAYEMPKQFEEDEVESKRGVLTLKDLVDVENGHSCDVNLDAFAVFFNSNGEQRDEVSCTERDGYQAVESGDKDGTSEERKTQIKVSRESHGMAMDAVGSGEARDVTTAGPDVQNSESVVRVTESASAKDGVSEHLPEKGEQFIPSSRPDRNLETRRTRSSVFSNVETAHHVQQIWIRFEGKARPVKSGGGRPTSWKRD